MLCSLIVHKDKMVMNAFVCNGCVINDWALADDVKVTMLDGIFKVPTFKLLLG